MVDDSGSNTFANSKNASVGSFREDREKVTVYRAKSDDSQAASPIN